MGVKDLVGHVIRTIRLDDAVRVLMARRRVTIVVYHDPAPESLRRHLAYFARRFSFITMDDFERALSSGRWGDLPPYPMVVTVDDGHAGNARLNAVFAEYKVRPTIFLCSQICGSEQAFWWKTPAAASIGNETLKAIPDHERRMRLRQAGYDPDGPQPARQALSWEEIGRLAAVADFGGHTRSHPILTQCTDAQSAEEIALCKTELEARLGTPCRHFAYPNGDHGEREVAELKRAGFATGRTIEVGWNGPDADPYRLKVIPVHDDASESWLAAQMTMLPSLLRAWKLRRDRRRLAAPVPEAALHDFDGATPGATP